MIEALKRLVLRCVAGISRRPTHVALAHQHQRLFGPCPACGGDLSGHHHWRLASAILDAADVEGGAAQRLEGLIAAKRWAEAASFQEWAGDRDGLEYHVIRCPIDGVLSMVAVLSNADMWADDRAENVDVMSVDDSAELAQVLEDLGIPGETLPTKHE